MVEVLDVANSLYWKQLVSLPCYFCMMTTTSEPPKVVSPPMTAPNWEPWATAWFKSFSWMVDALLVVSTLVSEQIANIV